MGYNWKHWLYYQGFYCNVVFVSGVHRTPFKRVRLTSWSQCFWKNWSGVWLRGFPALYVREEGHFFFFLRFYVCIFREGKGGKEREREKH